ncbi:stage II sporulation protein M [Phycicoccus endophyticus]|uniref:Stage II sporulation protein M n=1 Tax=Phycicoccus endophyticus TaxID=1690220 RepID=A0A7G9R2W4_9MICO|nr:stage II sporulation protein M [Phycicoccus endophyticus]NHI20414.1 stage II sporulation protein M [Phycicoccus endophyticus]QNN49939.1 stage II sporulation protein M [Phycicoccus endophyticus]GGL29430.1 membrane protein [Phycicoccus endophyticus]
MDLDAYVAAHQAQWNRLEALVGRRRLTGAEADELLDLYQRVSTQLSVVRSASPDPSVVTHLSSLVARARFATAGRRTSTWRALAGFFTTTFPAGLYRLRWWWVSTALANVAFAVLVGWYAYSHPRVWTSMMTPEEVEQFVGTDFEQYYSQYAHLDFTGLVWTNNAWVAAQVIALGVLGLPVFYVLAQNVLNVGVAGALMAYHDRTALFFGLILPHGLLELTAVFVAAAAGLRICWAWVSPGALPRGRSLAREARSGVGTAMGLAVVLFVSGVIEGFVTPSGLPTWARIAIGVLAESAFVLYVFVVGRAAAARGATGDLVARRDLGDALPVAG